MTWARSAFCAALVVTSAAWALSGRERVAAAPPPSEAAYVKSGCASCHGAKLEGGFGPALLGKPFVQKWGRDKGESLLEYVRKSMPPGNPGELSDDTYAAIINYIRLRNELPLGPDAAAAGAKQVIAPTAADVPDRGVIKPVENQDSYFADVERSRIGRLRAVTPVTEAMLVGPPVQDWLQWRRTYDLTGNSPLTQIDRKTVHNLTVAWSVALPTGTNEIAPIVHDGVMFLNSNGVVQAFDVRNGDLLWRYSRKLPERLEAVGLVSQPRSLSISGGAIFVPTIDGHIVSLDARSGAVLWDHAITGTKGLRLTAAPVVVKDKIIQGVSGCSGAAYPGGCFLVALDVATGDEVWRFHTVDQNVGNQDSWNGAPLTERFGGSIWTTPSYDPNLKLIFFGTGQTYHLTPLMERPKSGSQDALYMDSTLAVDPDSGKVAWHYQHTQREIWDLDWAFERTLVSLKLTGANRRAVITIGKMGILDALDARTGQYLFSYDLGLQTLVKGIDPVSGRKDIPATFYPPANKKIEVCPFAGGVRNWPATAVDPTNGRLFVGATEHCMDYYWAPSSGNDLHYGLKPRPASDGLFGRTVAIDLATKRASWMVRRRAPAASAILSTAGGLIFEGDRDRWFRAFNSDTGEVLWKLRLDATVSSFPISFAQDGAQYIAVTSGGGNPFDATPRLLTPEIPTSTSATTLWVFKLAEEP